MRTFIKQRIHRSGIKRRTSMFNTGRIDKFIEDPNLFEKRLFLHYGDLTDSNNLMRIINSCNR